MIVFLIKANHLEKWRDWPCETSATYLNGVVLIPERWVKTDTLSVYQGSIHLKNI